MQSQERNQKEVINTLSESLKAGLESIAKLFMPHVPQYQVNPMLQPQPFNPNVMNSMAPSTFTHQNSEGAFPLGQNNIMNNASYEGNSCRSVPHSTSPTSPPHCIPAPVSTTVSSPSSVASPILNPPKAHTQAAPGQAQTPSVPLQDPAPSINFSNPPNRLNSCSPITKATFLPN